MTEHDLMSLRWHRITAELACIRLVPAAKSHPVQIFQAIVKAVTTRVDGRDTPDSDSTVFFHLRDRRHTTVLRTGDRITLDIFFCRHGHDYALRWQDVFQHYFGDPENGKNFSLLEAGLPEERSLERLLAEKPHLPHSGELCMDFLSPFPFRHEQHKNRTWISADKFAQQLANRLSRLFGCSFTIPPSREYHLLPYYWNYTELRNQSHSQPGNTHYLNGCTGKLYIKGEFGELLPWLLLGTELHIGNRIGYSHGYYLIPELSPPHFCRQFPHRRAIHVSIKDVLERYDNAAESLAATEAYPFVAEKFAETLAEEIGQERYAPTPATAFAIKKKSGDERIIEQLRFRDMIVQQYIRTLVADPFDRILERGAIGFRRGMSRHTAAELIREALKEGFCYIIESDVEDFFPSIDHQRLEEVLRLYLPEGDTALMRLIMMSARTPCILNGRLTERTRGLAQGAPLSPLLANLYLDSFDEMVQSWGVRIIRFADDFIIMAKCMEDAEAVLAQAEGALIELGLGIKKEKTVIRHISEGFKYLGMRFDGADARDESIVDTGDLKKPLYITEPYVFLSLDGESLNIIKQKQVVEAIPLRRVSEIFVLEKATFSTGLARRCADFKIPLTITLNSGYFVASVKPDSRQYFDISYRHGLRYHAMNDTEHLCMAKEFAAGKLANYISFLKQRYEKGLAPFLREIERTIERIHLAADVNQVRGYEGSTAKKVYERLNGMIENPAFHIKKRGRMVPDPINALLNFAYYMLFSRINTIVRGVGLNPYLGFLHSQHDNYESLVCDIEELFRARIDRLVVRCINLKIISEQDFVEKNKRLVLNQYGTKKFLGQFEAELSRKNNKSELSLGEHIYVQVQVVKRAMLEDASFTCYHWEV